jgi:cobalt-zinc-cadmium efflux system membrane fusion protein
MKEKMLLGAALLAPVVGILITGGSPVASGHLQADESPRFPKDPAAAQSLELKSEEFGTYKVQPVEERIFALKREAVGSIDFNQELSTDVFPPVQGKILRLFAKAGDDVQRGAPLYTIDSPDLVQAESSLISAAGVLELTTRTLKRTQELYTLKGAPERDLEQARSDQQAAEGALKAARDAVRIFGKTDAEMDGLIAHRKIDPELVVPAAISGRVVARNAAPGALAQPGSPPAPYTLSDISTLWMLADVAESDFGVLQLGQAVDVRVRAYPDRLFQGKLVNIGASVDPSTRRVAVRSEVADPHHELRAGMSATFVIRIGEARSVAMPQNGIIREGDGSMSVWVATGEKAIVRRTVKIGILQDGFYQVLEGLAPGERAATEAALFLSTAVSDSR